MCVDMIAGAAVGTSSGPQRRVASPEVSKYEREGKRQRHESQNRTEVVSNEQTTKFNPYTETWQKSMRYPPAT